jgi:hypothetical protein
MRYGSLCYVRARHMHAPMHASVPKLPSARSIATCVGELLRFIGGPAPERRCIDASRLGACVYWRRRGFIVAVACLCSLLNRRPIYFMATSCIQERRVLVAAPSRSASRHGEQNVGSARGNSHSSICLPLPRSAQQAWKAAAIVLPPRSRPGSDSKQHHPSRLQFIF